MTNHTPAPWTHTQWGEIIVISGEIETGIAHINPSGNYRVGIPSPQNEANARLIADAPELLQALSDILEHCALIQKVWGENAINVTPFIEKAQALVAKHTGEYPNEK